MEAQGGITYVDFHGIFITRVTVIRYENEKLQQDPLT